MLACLFADAYAAGSVAVTGQADPRWLRELTDAHATFTCPSLGVLVQAKDREILDAIQRGDAALSRLDGEWWLRSRWILSSTDARRAAAPRREVRGHYPLPPAFRRCDAAPRRDVPLSTGHHASSAAPGSSEQLAWVT